MISNGQSNGAEATKSSAFGGVKNVEKTLWVEGEKSPPRVFLPLYYEIQASSIV